MEPKVGTIYHIKDEGWAIVSDILLIDTGDQVKGLKLKFYTLEFFDGKPRTFFVPVDNFKNKPSKLPDMCNTRKLRRTEIFKIRPGEQVFFVDFHGKLEYGTVSSVIADKMNINVKAEDYSITVKPWEVRSYHHSYNKIPGTPVEKCIHCGAIHTPTRKDNVINLRGNSNGEINY